MNAPQPQLQKLLEEISTDKSLNSSIRTFCQGLASNLELTKHEVGGVQSIADWLRSDTSQIVTALTSNTERSSSASR